MIFKFCVLELFLIKHNCVMCKREEESVSFCCYNFILFLKKLFIKVIKKNIYVLLLYNNFLGNERKCKMFLYKTDYKWISFKKTLKLKYSLFWPHLYKTWISTMIGLFSTVWCFKICYNNTVPIKPIEKFWTSVNTLLKTTINPFYSFPRTDRNEAIWLGIRQIILLVSVIKQKWCTYLSCQLLLTNSLTALEEPKCMNAYVKMWRTIVFII